MRVGGGNDLNLAAIGLWVRFFQLARFDNWCGRGSGVAVAMSACIIAQLPRGRTLLDKTRQRVPERLQRHEHCMTSRPNFQTK